MGLKKCKGCDGSGASCEEDKNGRRKICSECNGEGRVSTGKENKYKRIGKVDFE